MRYLFILILLSSCSANFHLKQAIKKGLKPETTIVTKTDSIYIGSVSDSLTQIVLFQTETVKSDCDSLLKANPVKEPVYIRKIQKEVCPRIAVDSIYQIPFIVQDSTYFIPVHVLINSEGGKFKWKLTGKEIDITVKTHTTKNTYTSENRIKWWWLVVTAFVFLLIGLLFKRK